MSVIGIRTRSYRVGEHSRRGWPGSVSRPLRILVPYTTEDHTRAALNAAAAMARDLRAEVILVALQVVPYPLPLDRPHVHVEFTVRRLRNLVMNSSLSARVELVFARNKSDALKTLIDPASLVLLTTEDHWWRTAEERLTRTLIKQGCNVSLLTLPLNM